MKFNPTFLEILVCLVVCLFIFIWTKHGRRIRRWLQDYFRRRHGPRSLKPEGIPWSERKSPRGRPKTIDTSGHACLNPLCDYFAVADPAIHALVSNGRRGKQRILYLKCQSCGGCRTSCYGTPLYWLKTPLTQIAMVMIAMSEGVDISAAGRIFDHHQTTITRWIERCGRHSERLHERLFHQALSIGHLQLDELMTKVKQGAERLWIWTAVAARSKLILALHIGRLGSHQLVRAGLKALSFSGIVQTAFVERTTLTLRELIAPLSRRTWSIADDSHPRTEQTPLSYTNDDSQTGAPSLDSAGFVAVTGAGRDMVGCLSGY